MPDERQRRRIAGSVLIIVGLVLFLLQFVGGMHEGLVLILVGVSFLVAYAYRPSYGLLIPGCILAGLGLGLTAERLGVAWGEPTVVGLGAGFVVIYLVALAHLRVNRPWPLIPGAILILVGVVPESDTLQWLFEVGWPLIIVVIGAFILLGGFWGARDEPEPAEAGAPREGADAPVAGPDTAPQDAGAARGGAGTAREGSRAAREGAGAVREGAGAVREGPDAPPEAEDVRAGAGGRDRDRGGTAESRDGSPDESREANGSADAGAGSAHALDTDTEDDDQKSGPSSSR